MRTHEAIPTKTRALAVFALACAGLTFAACSAAQPASPEDPRSASKASPAVGKSTAPDFELEALDGQTFRLSRNLGKVVLLDFWATWCEPCKASMPLLDDLYRRHHDEGLLVVGISIDGPESVAQVRTEVAKTRVTFPILLDPETQVITLYSPKRTAPYQVLIGRDGRLLSEREGFMAGEFETLSRDVQVALAHGSR